MLILDTNVLVAALRSRTGQSRVLLKQILERKRIAGVSVPLFLEYEAVLLRPDNLKSFGLSSHQVIEFLDGLAGCLKPIDVTYLWRPQLRDPADEMVLEAAVNGSVSHLITWNQRDFFPAALRFNLQVMTPADYLQTFNRE